ncbi:anthranilate synthase component I family protein [Psychroflexus halocasei]|uniref:Anthranilate synthase component 1 n=1 Tax=Psychroflexus halocasei TaxID=908615 RepID=A0A1H3WLZ1_9FLAO|nr:chorismate-binding protein [Psychroflexus halocasei]SDZ87352.1 anthranilate synthase component 1 [Psychroflexus halocasei]
MKLKSTYHKILSDTITPVSIYLKIRDQYPGSLLLESSDYHTNNNSFSYICMNPIASFKLENELITIEKQDQKDQQIKLTDQEDLNRELKKFRDSFEIEKFDFKFTTNALFGYTAYDAIRYFENVDIKKRKDNIQIPDLYYAVYQNIIVINHFNNEAYIFNHSADDINLIPEINHIISSQTHSIFHFDYDENITSNFTDDEFKLNVSEAKKHCQRGDIFQMVLSRRFEQKFKGDEFNVYRTLRSINPSPYLFYFDYTDFKIFGSSPEAQLVVNRKKAEIHPIAGTFKRTGQDEEDVALAKELSEDPKENSEHVMLVDLARNDLSKNGRNVKLETDKEVQFFSHVIHLVSKVTADIKDDKDAIDLAADCFPAGTLSGAPKPKALELIEKYETLNRNHYGGAIGILDFEGNYNHAIIIRSFLSKNHHLYYQAGAGIVNDSDPNSELEEVYNKLKALKKAMALAKKI